MSKTEYDAIVVGSGPNGLAAAITLQKQGLSVLLIEGAKTIGGGLRSSELTLPGFIHDECSAIHPMLNAAPFFSSLGLYGSGLKMISGQAAAAHPFDDGTSVTAEATEEITASFLGKDKAAYLDLIQPVVKDWLSIRNDVLGPLSFPTHPIKMAKFGLNALQSADSISKRFQTREGRGLWAGMAAHSILPLTKLTTAAIGIVLLANAHIMGWGFPEGGSQQIANSLAFLFKSLGGKIQTDQYVRSLKDLPSAKAVLFDVTPKQLLEIAGHNFSSIYKWQLNRYRYGMGVFKVDWALNEPIPFTSSNVKRAPTVHIGNTYEEIAASEQMTWEGKHPEKPFVLLAQPSLFDSTRAPKGKHTGWAYCHVPNGSTVDMTDAIEKQVERFAPGFRDTIIARSTRNTQQMEEKNPNYVGGDINGGMLDITQLFTRPALRSSPYRTSAKGIYICSSSTPPGGGVHGMCGYHAARRALKDVFNISIDLPKR